MNTLVKTPAWFYILAAIALVWNAMGIFAYLSTVMMSAEDFAKTPEAMQNLQNATPAWAMAAFATAVFAGTLGCLLLLLKKKLAFIFLFVSLIAVILQMGNFIFLMNGFDVVSQSDKIMTYMIIVVAFLLVWFAKFSDTKRWLK